MLDLINSLFGTNMVLAGAVRWLVNVVVTFLLAHNLIAQQDVAAWSTTFSNYVYASISILMLLWTVAQNRWPSLVKAVANLRQVDVVSVNPSAAAMDPTLIAHPSVKVSTPIGKDPAGR